MLTKQDEGLVAGIRGIEWDAVELPSQFMENWCYHRLTSPTNNQTYIFWSASDYVSFFLLKEIKLDVIHACGKYALKALIITSLGPMFNNAFCQQSCGLLVE